MKLQTLLKEINTDVPEDKIEQAAKILTDMGGKKDVSADHADILRKAAVKLKELGIA